VRYAKQPRGCDKPLLLSEQDTKEDRSIKVKNNCLIFCFWVKPDPHNSKGSNVIEGDCDERRHPSLVKKNSVAYYFIVVPKLRHSFYYFHQCF